MLDELRLHMQSCTLGDGASHNHCYGQHWNSWWDRRGSVCRRENNNRVLMSTKVRAQNTQTQTDTNPKHQWDVWWEVRERTKHSCSWQDDECSMWMAELCCCRLQLNTRRRFSVSLHVCYYIGVTYALHLVFLLSFAPQSSISTNVPLSQLWGLLVRLWANFWPIH